MQISPVYDTTPILAIEGLGDPSGPVTRQRQRLLAVLRTLTAEQWDAPSRCAKWSVKDVVSHLAGTDAFWTLSLDSAMRGQPTTLLTNFDPVATPEQMVDGMRALSPTEVLAQYDRNANNLLDVLWRIRDWTMLAEAPPGHIAANATALHALWDAWVHERDILVPLGLPTIEDPDEVSLVLQYAAALSPAFAAASGEGPRGTLAVVATDPDVSFTVEVGDRVLVRPGAVGEGPLLSGRAVELVEALSHRGPPPELAAADQWLLRGLAEVFDKLR